VTINNRDPNMVKTKRNPIGIKTLSELTTLRGSKKSIEKSLSSYWNDKTLWHGIHTATDTTEKLTITSYKEIKNQKQYSPFQPQLYILVVKLKWIS